MDGLEARLWGLVCVDYDSRWCGTEGDVVVDGRGGFVWI